MIKEIFKKRKIFDETNSKFEFPDFPSLYTKYYIDTWSVIPFYGKVDTLGIPIIPNNFAIRYCSQTKDTNKVQVLQPSLDFFFQLRREYEKYYAFGAFNKSGKYFKNTLPPIKGYIQSDEEYANIVNNKLESFRYYLIKNNKNNQIKNYDDYLNQFMNFIKENKTYFTRAGFVESTDYSMLHTGLAIDIYDGDPSNEEERLNFIKDNNANNFLELCIRSNVKIHREIPWRLFIDIRTKENKNDEYTFEGIIKKYIPEFKDNLQLFFDKYYTRVIPYDENSYQYFVEFVTNLQSGYDGFSSGTDRIYKKYLINNCGKADVKIFERDVLNENEFTYDPIKYLDLYLRFRNIELIEYIDFDEAEQIIVFSKQIYNSIYKKDGYKKAIVAAVKYHTDNVGTLAYRYPSLYELDEKSKMP